MKNIRLGNMPFTKKIELRMVASILIALIGVTAIVLVTSAFPLNTIADSGHSEGFMRGFYVGTGAGLIAGGIITFIKQLILLKNDEKRKKAELKESDERNLFLATRTAYLTLIISATALYIAIISTGIFNPALASILLAVFGGLFLIYLVVYAICNKVY